MERRRSWCTGNNIPTLQIQCLHRRTQKFALQGPLQQPLRRVLKQRVPSRSKDLDVPMSRNTTQRSHKGGVGETSTCCSEQASISVSVPVSVPKVKKRREMGERESEWFVCAEIFKGNWMSV